MKRYLPLNWLLALTFVGTTQLVFAREVTTRPTSTGQPSTPNRVNVSCQVSASKAELDVNNVRAMVLNGGDMWWNLTDARYEIPKKTNPNLPKQHSIFAGAVWLGGVDPTGQLFTAAQTYRQNNGVTPEVGYWPGPLDAQGSVTEDVCSAWNSHAKINRTVIDAFRANFGAGRVATKDDIPQTVREWPGRNNPYLDRPAIDNELAPFVDVNFDNIYDPLQGDYPDVRGDQAIWWVMNDVGNIKTPNTPAIGLELAVQAFAFQTNDPLNNMTFYKQRLSNKGSRTLLKTYMGQWVDPDLGWFNDDYVGCDVSRGLGICYNGDNFDEGVNGYGQNPPAIGVDFFEGPLADANDSIDNDRDSYPQGIFNPNLVDEPGEKIIMSNFVYYNNDPSLNGNPTIAGHYYNYLRSKIHDGSDLKFGGNGVAVTGPSDPYAFMFAAGAGYQSDPLGWGYGNKYTDSSKNPLAGNSTKGDGTGRPPFDWSESKTSANTGTQPNLPADRRFLQSAGPFTLRPGAVNNITIGVVWASAGSGGPQGSLNLLLYADDLAQALFDGDFQIPDGPPAPIVTASELDKQVVLAIQPKEVCTSTNGCYNTETYALEDTRLPASIPDRVYRFEGYLVYQLLNSTVTASEVANLDKARLIARGDIINGVTQIINYEYNVDVNAVVPSVKVTADNADQGIFHTLNITEDKFATGNSRLINNKEYTFLVIPYAYNADKTKGPNGPLVQSPYLQGRFTSKITVTPHQSLFEQNGLVLNSNVYDQVAITRSFGQGAGNRQLEISEADEANILQAPNYQKLDLSYKKGFGPFSVRIYDPKLVRNAEFTVKLSSRLMVSKRGLSASRGFQVGDILESTGQFARAETPANALRTWQIDNAVIQTPGRAIIHRILSGGAAQDTAYVFDVEMLNDDQGGTFTAQVRRLSTSTGTPLEGYNDEPRGIKTSDGAITGIATEYNQNDFWRWRLKEATTWNYVARRVSEVNEELIPAYGLSIQIQPGHNPGFKATLNPQTQFIGASLKHSGTEWLTGVPGEQGELENTILGVDWLLPPRLQGIGSTTETWDPSGVYSNILPISIGGGAITFRGTWAAYVDVRPAATNGGYITQPTRRLNNLRNVDVVFTPDRTKWTRVPVLQINYQNPNYALTKRGSTKPSIDVNGLPDPRLAPNGQPSIGMGWFPGYAVDLDRGERLNMMFSESSAPESAGGQGPDKGADLIWEPNSTKQAGQNFVYVLDTKYDGGVEMEGIQDDAATKPAGVAKFIYQDAYDHIMWVGYPKLRDQRTIFQNNSTARVSIRVDRAFASYPELPANTTGPANTPQYSFSLNEQAVRTGQTSVLCDALSKTRIVPNPYYAFSQYEQRQLDNIVKITNLPQRAEITIYTLNGTLVRRLRKDTQLTTFDWNMKNESGLPISSGVYLFHIKAPDAGCETVVKWFGVMRPIDLDTF